MPNMSLKKNEMPSQEPNVRNKNFLEVALGYTEEQALDEAARCLNCKNHPCVSGCPVQVKIPEFIKKITEKDYEGAYQVIHETSSLPAVCGRVCPQETQCESKCIRGIKGEPVGIGRLERFVADWHNANVQEAPAKPAPNGHKVAVIGSGPSGLTCAGDLAKKGYDVTVFEALHLAGGVLVYGIPEFRLPKAIVQKEVDGLKALGVKVETNMVIGRVVSIDELMSEYGFEAVFIGSGAGLPMFMHIPGENLCGVYSANEFLTRINLMKAYKDGSDTPIMPLQGKKVAVVGGGNTAMDAARLAKRSGAKQVTLVYRRTRKYMPADEHELALALQDGVTFAELAAPVKQADGVLTCEKMVLGEADASGRRSPVGSGEFFDIPCDLVISAVGEQVDSALMAANGIEVDKKGRPAFQTNLPGVYAAGDATRGPATVVEGIADAARFAQEVIGQAYTYDIPQQAYITKTDAQAKKGILNMSGCVCQEGSRCLQCSTVCENCVDSCPNRANVAIAMADGSHQILHVDKMCNECGNCTQFCPYASEPCHDKFTLFQTAEDMEDSHNAGVLFLEGGKVRVRLAGAPQEYNLDEANDLPRELETFILTIRDQYGYLFA